MVVEDDIGMDSQTWVQCRGDPHCVAKYKLWTRICREV
jgi:hypothetical protein